MLQPPPTNQAGPLTDVYSNHTQVAAEPGVPKTSTVEQLAYDREVDEFSDAGSSVDDLLSPPAVPTDSADQLFTPAQLLAIQDTVSCSISVALANLPRSGNPPLDLAFSSTRSHHASDILYQPQSLHIQFWLEDSSPGSPGSPLTFIQRKKPVVDTWTPLLLTCW